MKKTFAAALLTLAALAFASSSAYAEDLYFDSDGVKIRYRVEGSGEPIVLIHGFGINIEANWDARGVWQALSKDYRVIGLDLRGHGKSEKPRDPADYGPHVKLLVIREATHGTVVTHPEYLEATRTFVDAHAGASE